MKEGNREEEREERTNKAREKKETRIKRGSREQEQNGEEEIVMKQGRRYNQE